MADDDEDLEVQARGPRTGFARELLAFMKANKKWWLVPIVLSLLLLGVLAVVGGSAAAPFIYPLF